MRYREVKDEEFERELQVNRNSWDYFFPNEKLVGEERVSDEC